MPYFNEEHPLHEFNEDFYIESGKEKEHVYIFKFNNQGAQVVLDLINSKEPLAFIYPLIFTTELSWDNDMDKKIIVLSGSKSVDDILLRIQKELRYIKHGKITSEDS